VGGNDFTYTINIDNAEIVKTPLPISDFCEGVETIILETTEESLLSRVDKVVRVGDRLYVFDRRTNVVLEFDMDGKFIKRFGMTGRGPGEYSRIYDFTVDAQNKAIYLLDRRTRIISYDLESGKYIEDISTANNDYNSTFITSVGELVYATLHYREFSESNYMLSSFNIADSGVENYYLPTNEYVKGWSITELVSNSNFIFNHGNDYALFSDMLSPEIMKLTGEVISNYIYIESEEFIDEKGRIKLSEAWKVTTDEDRVFNRTLIELDCFTTIPNYFETDEYICFRIMRGSGNMYQFVYNKANGKVKRVGYFNNNLIINVKYNTEPNPVEGLLMGTQQADAEGILCVINPWGFETLRTAAREGKLVENLDRLDELKQLPEDSNPVLFYMKFKNPLK
jgi:hypothetical protein